MQNASDELIRPARAAKMLDLCRRTLRRYEIEGKLTPIKINPRVTRYRMSDVVRLTQPEQEAA